MASTTEYTLSGRHEESSMSDEIVSVEMDRELARELAGILHAEVENADEIHQTENTMLFAANLIDDTLES